MPSLLNEQIDDQLVFERQESFAGGEDDYRRSTLIDPDQCQKLVNIVVRDNYEAWTRPGADLFVPFTTDNYLRTDAGDVILSDVDIPLETDEDAVAPGPIMALQWFDTPLNKTVLAVFSQRLYACIGYNVTWQPTTGWTPATSDARVAMAQGVDTCLLSDGIGAMAIVDSSLGITVCGTGANDPPVGANILCWHAGRMFAGGFGTYPDTLYVSNLLEFGDGQWDAVNRSFRVGNGDGDAITAMYSMQDFVLAVFKQNSIWLIDTNPVGGITDWNAQDLGSRLGFGIGCVGKKAVAGKGNDVFFMAQDGVRTLRRMQAAAGQWELSAPISQPVQQYIDRINRSAWSLIEAVSYQEFILFAIPLDSSPVNDAVLVFNTRLGRWIGLWTNWSVNAWCKARFGSQEQLLFGNPDGELLYWKDREDSNSANTYLDNGEPITGQKLWTRAYQFGDPVINKAAYNCALRFTAGNASLRVTSVMDLSETQSFVPTVTPSGDLLGQGLLGSFRLASVRPVKVEKSLRSLQQFNELYLKIEAESGWFKLRNITLSAFPKAFNG